MKQLSLLFVFCTAALFSHTQEKISLAGNWQVQLDPDSSYYIKNQRPPTYSSRIQLPGTTDEAKLGIKTSGSDYGILTRVYKYIGPAWYRRQITIPVNWAGKDISLYLERVLWESKVFVDGREISTLSPLYVPHRHRLGRLKPGTHTLDICINNDLIHNIGDKGHGYTEYTQSIWNGIVGRIELQAASLAISQVKTYPDAEKEALRLEVFLSNAAARNLTLSVTIKDAKTGALLKKSAQPFTAKQGENKVTFLVNKLTGVKNWDEFTPNLYEVTLTARQEGHITVWKDKIGFRKISTTQHKILINNRTTFIRGNLDCVHFPLTGYPSCNVKDWESIFKKYKDYGLNTVRFHSWTPPEAAFEAADKVGIYIQTEIIWLDWWMAGEQKDRPEMNTKGYPQGLGHNADADAFVQAEMNRVLEEYGNHPSFLFFCIGNELGNSDFNVMQQWIEKVKQEDPRRLYAVSTARKITTADDYMVTHNIPNIGGTYGYSLNKTDAGLENNYSKATIPIIAHEVGQVPVYPQWKEIDKYTGVLKARNLEGFKAAAEKNGVVAMDEKFHQSTGRLQQLLYKNLVENITLVPSSAGFQLLSMQDYQGQGEALIGWLDCFWDDKGTTPAKEFKGYSNTVVPLIRTASFTYTRGDTLKLDMELANHYKTDIQKKLVWTIADAAGNLMHKGLAGQHIFPQGLLIKAGSLSLPLNSFPDKAAQYTFKLYFEDESYSNSWPFFVFPEAKEKTVTTDGIYVATQWDASVDSVLAGGGKVLLLASKLGTKATSAPVSFTPLFWSASFFPGQSNQTLGSFINNKSEAFNYFPTESFTSWQWFKITPGAKYFNLSNMPKDYQPLAQPVSDFHYNEKLGSIFETKAGNGKLLVCGYALQQENNAYAQQLFYSLTSYMKTPAFAPKDELPLALLKEKLASIPQATSSAPLPDQFKNAALFIRGGAKAAKAKYWEAADDSILVNKKYQYHIAGTAYSVIHPSGTAWDGTNFSINLQPPAGVKGYIYFHLINDPKRKGEGTITVEGRELKTGDIPVTGKWIKIFMMREDTNDGKVAIQLVSDGAAPLLVNQLIVVEEE
ncbi:glycoside hydrolase family 2 TIM barrel-domain containing protein [Niabella hirudinis]|uniref:glycoside hydrolase family 2 TIM barrel-domain containing protein n=1 Tax=Niabella hirudinis TaxID=1285929 RepID=UPI003EB8C497